jgi:hypothetical protein
MAREAFMTRLPRLILIFALLFAAFILGPPFLSPRFAAYPLMQIQDVVDLLTPLVLIPAYWLLFQLDCAKPPAQNETIVFLVLAALWVEGQGMHLAANSIGHLTQGLAGTDVAALTHFYDEVLSHYMWHAAVIGFSILLIYRQWKNPFPGGRSRLGTQVGAGILHGLNYGLMVLEGATTPLGVPAAGLITLFGIVWGRGKLRQQPLLAFFFVAYLVATLLFILWRLYWGSFIEPFDALKRL